MTVLFEFSGSRRQLATLPSNVCEVVTGELLRHGVTESPMVTLSGTSLPVRSGGEGPQFLLQKWSDR